MPGAAAPGVRAGRGRRDRPNLSAWSVCWYGARRNRILGKLVVGVFASLRLGLGESDALPSKALPKKRYIQNRRQRLNHVLCSVDVATGHHLIRTVGFTLDVGYKH
ncbi:uncharacterized protein LOC112664042 [Canis lupus dingo]|uniref:uncharacterized protein LOC112664042 n=1 Tax=Canis lupus dingo TaxID=286419 RepID=UPI0020C52ED1|nr:uncharacterized protein LOC112664042 [Canis lupus dingo]